MWRSERSFVWSAAQLVELVNHPNSPTSLSTQFVSFHIMHSVRRLRFTAERGAPFAPTHPRAIFARTRSWKRAILVRGATCANAYTPSVQFSSVRPSGLRAGRWARTHLSEWLSSHSAALSCERVHLTGHELLPPGSMA